MVTEENEVLIAVEDLRQDPTLPLPLASAAAAAAASGGEIERGGSADSRGSLSASMGGGGGATKFSPVPVAGEKLTVLLR